MDVEETVNEGGSRLNYQAVCHQHGQFVGTQSAVREVMRDLQIAVYHDEACTGDRAFQCQLSLSVDYFVRHGELQG